MGLGAILALLLLLSLGALLLMVILWGLYVLAKPPRDL